MAGEYMRNMEKALFLMLLMAAIGLPMRSIGQYNGLTVIATDSYVLQLGNFTQPATINNAYRFTPLPKISIDGGAIDLKPSIDSGEFANPADKYVIEKTEVKNQMTVNVRMEIREKTITVKTSVQNGGSEPHTIGLTYTVDSERNMLLFSPVNYHQSNENHFALLGPDKHGYALGMITASPLQPGIPNLIPITQYATTVNIPDLGSGGTAEFTVVYYPFNLQLNEQRSYPLELSSFMQEPLVRHGPLERQLTSAQANIHDKVREMLSMMAELPKADAEFREIHDVDFAATSMDSLDLATYFKEGCIQNGIPCRIVIGRGASGYYAWVQFYDGAWVDADPFAGIISKPAGHEASYLEPQNELHTASEDSEAGLYGAIGFLSGVGQNNFLLYLIILIVATVSVVVIFHTKSKTILRYVEKREATAKAEAKIVSPEFEPAGEYEILKERAEGDVFLKDLLQKIRESNGIVDIVKFAEEMGFSKELIKYSIIHLHEEGYIKKKGEVAAVSPASAFVPEFKKKQRLKFLNALKIEKKPKVEKPREIAPLKATGKVLVPIPGEKEAAKAPQKKGFLGKLRRK